MHIVNPATEELIVEMAEDNWQTVQDKWGILKEGQPIWAEAPLEKRIHCLRRFGELLEDQQGELAATLTSEMGKPLSQSRSELAGARGRIKFFVEHGQKYLSDEWITREGLTKEKIAYEPLGIIANISAWNYPYLVGVNVFVPALMAGNGVLYKPSEFATLTGLNITRLLYQAGVPENAFQMVTGKGPSGGFLLDLPLNGYFFTGSYKTGRLIASKVASKLVVCQFELGGKDPLYVMDDVEDMEKTAADVLEGVVYNNGQSCCAVERVYVHENAYVKFLEAIVRQAKNMIIGDPMDPSTQIGPLTRSEQMEFLLSQIRDATSKGAKILTGGKKRGGLGYFLEPTLLVDVNHEMKLMTEESFGPVVGIQRVSSDEQALELMQDSPYGLTASIYSKNYDRAERMMKKLNTGTVYWNCCDRVSANLPWSGRKQSGVGTTLSYQGIRAFVQPKAYHLRG
jgi:acyl-CoA reductase-like NAD-dependent aldehyde dehydrogenase